MARKQIYSIDELIGKAISKIIVEGCNVSIYTSDNIAYNIFYNDYTRSFSFGNLLIIEE